MIGSMIPNFYCCYLFPVHFVSLNSRKTETMVVPEKTNNKIKEKVLNEINILKYLEVIMMEDDLQIKSLVAVQKLHFRRCKLPYAINHFHSMSNSTETY